MMDNKRPSAKQRINDTAVKTEAVHGAQCFKLGKNYRLPKGVRRGTGKPEGFSDDLRKITRNDREDCGKFMDKPTKFWANLEHSEIALFREEQISLKLYLFTPFRQRKDSLQAVSFQVFGCIQIGKTLLDEPPLRLKRCTHINKRLPKVDMSSSI